MVSLNILGVAVDFPFEPYTCQLKYMEKVITCLQKGVNGALESPTGTGKTLCLLCATLGWRETYVARLQLERVGKRDTNAFNDNLGSTLGMASGEKNAGGSWERGFLDAPKIIYASRTHSQLTQCVNELKNTRYKPKICVLGSRGQMCINSEVMKEESNNGKVHMCRMKVAAKQCFYYNNMEACKDNLPSGILDIEDLVAVGVEKRFCPYYMAREIRKEADLIFMPYNYVLDFKARSKHGVDLTNTIILLDEAHNLESHCESNSSFDLTSFDLASCVEDSQQCIELLVDGEREGLSLDEGSVGDLTTEDASLMKTLFLKLESFICDITLSSEGSVTKPASFLFDELAKLNVTLNTKEQILDTLTKMSGMITAAKTKVFRGRNFALDKFADALKTMFLRNKESASGNDEHLTTKKYYKVHICVEERKKSNKNVDVWTKSSVADKNTARTLSYWCFNPGLTMRELRDQGVRSIILTSGTLSPLASFKAELLIPFEVELENGHVIDKSQVFVGILSHGPDGRKLNSSYQFRSTSEYQVSLGNTIVNFSRIIPHGLLVFFPSYPVMDMVLAKWQECGIWNRINSNKSLFVEPRNKSGFNETIDQFYQMIHNPSFKGAVFFAVCRGKVSEGLDFADANGRAVVITGLPFPPSFDPRVVLKKQYLDEQKDVVAISGKDWYRQQASRAVNQAIGRVIRHRNDFGAILLCDERFALPSAKTHLPCWIKQQAKAYNDFGHAQRDLVVFFRDIQEKMGPVVTKCKSKRKIDPVEALLDHSTKRKTLKLFDEGETSAVHRNVKSHGVFVEPLQSLASIKCNTPAKASVFDSIHTPQAAVPERRPHETSLSQAILSKQTAGAKQKAKKYKLVKSTKTSFEPITENNRTSTREDAKHYLLKVKSSLSKSLYAKFGAAMTGYKQQGDVKSLIETFKDVFDRNSLQHMDLFKGFSFFIRKEADKQLFLEACDQLLGLSP